MLKRSTAGRCDDQNVRHWARCVCNSDADALVSDETRDVLRESGVSDVLNDASDVDGVLGGLCLRKDVVAKIVLFGIQCPRTMTSMFIVGAHAAQGSEY